MHWFLSWCHYSTCQPHANIGYYSSTNTEITCWVGLDYYMPQKLKLSHGMWSFLSEPTIYSTVAKNNNNNNAAPSLEKSVTSSFSGDAWNRFIFWLFDVKEKKQNQNIIWKLIIVYLWLTLVIVIMRVIIINSLDTCHVFLICWFITTMYNSNSNMLNNINN